MPEQLYGFRKGRRMADEQRPLRVCDECGQIDDHPRARHMLDPDSVNVPRHHITAVAGRRDLDPRVLDDAISELLDPVSACRHFDCCAATGCAFCTATLDAANARGKTGDDVVRAVQRHGDAIAEQHAQLIEAQAKAG